MKFAVMFTQDFWKYQSYHQWFISWYVYDVIMLAIIYAAITFSNISSGTMDIPTMSFGTNPANSYANNTLFSYPIKLSGEYCWPSTLHDCLSSLDSSLSCCKKLYDINSYPYEEVSSEANLIISITIPIMILLIRIFIFKCVIERILSKNYILLRDTSIKRHDDVSLPHHDRIHTNDETRISSDIHWNDNEDFVLLPYTSSSSSSSLSSSSSSFQGRSISYDAMDANRTVHDSLIDVEDPNQHHHNINPSHNDDEDRKMKPSSCYKSCSHLMMRYFHNSSYILSHTTSSSPTRIHHISSYFWLHHSWTSIMCVLLCLAYQALLVDYLKEKVSAPRPMYYALHIYSSIHASSRSNYDLSSHRSWPSGHSSTIAACLGYAILILLKDAHDLMRHHHHPSISRALVYLAASLLAIICYVGATRIRDYWHFAHDVVTGWMLGFIIAAMVFFTCATPTHQNMIYIYHRIISKLDYQVIN